MDWITEASEQWKDQRVRKETIQRETAGLWDRICGATEGAVKAYEALSERPRHAKLSGRTALALYVAIFEGKGSTFGMQVGRIAIVLDQKQKIVQIRTAGAAPRKFPIGLDQAGRACVTAEGREIPVDEFTKVALYDVFFPKEETSPLDVED